MYCSAAFFFLAFPERCSICRCVPTTCSPVEVEQCNTFGRTVYNITYMINKTWTHL